MKTASVKNILILVFLVVDLALGIIWFADRHASEDESVRTVCALLKKKGISLQETLIPKPPKSLPPLELHNADYGKDRLPASRPFDGTLTEADARLFIEELGYSTDHAVCRQAEDGSFVFTQEYAQIPLLKSRLVVSKEGDHIAATGTFYTPAVSASHNNLAIVSPLVALTKLLREPNLPQKAAVTDIYLAYAEYLSDEDSRYAEGSATAVWCICLNSGDVFCYEAWQ